MVKSPPMTVNAGPLLVKSPPMMVNAGPLMVKPPPQVASGVLAPTEAGNYSEAIFDMHEGKVRGIPPLRPL
eukprot:1533744-Pyramimonas_sp.AAC.1